MFERKKCKGKDILGKSQRAQLQVTTYVVCDLTKTRLEAWSVILQCIN